MSDPDAVTALYWLALFCALMGIVWLAVRPRPRRNRYVGMPRPQPDSRDWQGEFERSNKP